MFAPCGTVHALVKVPHFLYLLSAVQHFLVYLLLRHNGAISFINMPVGTGVRQSKRNFMLIAEWFMVKTYLFSWRKRLNLSTNVN